MLGAFAVFCRKNVRSFCRFLPKKCEELLQFFAEKMLGAFAMQKLLTIFQQKNIIAVNFVSTV